MKKPIKILLAIVGVFVVLVALGGVGAFLFIRSHVDHETVSEPAARASLEMTRRQFNGVSPLIEMRPGGPAFTRPIPDVPPTARLRTVHIVQWNPENGALMHADLPFGLLRMKNLPLQFVTSVKDRDGFQMKQAMAISGDNIERFGPALLFDQDMPDGSHFLIWTE